MQTHFIAFVFLLFCVASAFGQTVTKCVDSNGKVSYSDTECAGQRRTIKITPNSIGDGGAELSQRKLLADTKLNAVESASRRFREANDRIVQLRKAIANNDAEKALETLQLSADQEQCRSAGNFSRRCKELQSQSKSTIEAKYHGQWMSDHKAWSTAISESQEAMKQLIALGAPLPK